MKPLVLLHGFTGSPAGFDLVLEHLGDTELFLRPALLGHDGGANNPAVKTFRDEVDRLASQIASWAPEPAQIVGYSLGARVALGLLVHHPKLWASAVLIGLNPGLADPEERAARTAADDRWRAVLDRGDLEAFINAWSSQTLFQTQDRLPRHVLDQQRRQRHSHCPAGLSQALRLLGLAAMPSYWDELHRIEVPIDLLVGELDPKFLSIAESVTTKLPQARIHVAPQAGHNLLLEAPAEVARIIRKGTMA